MKHHIARTPIGINIYSRLTLSYPSSKLKRLLEFSQKHKCYCSVCPSVPPFKRFFATKSLAKRWISRVLNGKTDVKIVPATYKKVLYLKVGS